MNLIRLIVAIQIACSIVSCKPPKEETGLARYYIENDSDYKLQIKTYFVASVNISCDTCTIEKHSKILLGMDSNFGHAPTPNEAINQVNIYRDDTLKIKLDMPYADSIWTRIKGKGDYDNDFFLKITNGML